MKKIRLSKFIKMIVVILFLISVAASFYFFHVAQVRDDKSFISNGQRKPGNSLYAYDKSFDKLLKQKIEMTNQNIKQVAWYVPAAKKTHKTAVVVHGFANSKENMKAYGWLFHKLGYNVLMPDNIAHGESHGQLIGYGWNDRENIIKWTEMIVDNNPSSQITLFGVSMGGATVMMASGEKLPSQVVNIIEDCGYSSVWDELKFQAKEMYGLPAFPLLYEVSTISKIRAGFSYGQASSVEQLKKNNLPALFIHGDKDNFVPTSMVYDNYKATAGKKELYIVKGAKHAKSFETEPEKYEKRISSFLKKYEK
ncbi:TPA: alpha/beta hydrolase [Streptococcus agalactiae]